jgi:hypothetical protein
MIPAVIAQLKFVATYMVPSAYPSLLTALSVLAAAVLPPPGSEWPFAANVFMWLGVLLTGASLALVIKQLFRRQPSLNEILSGLVTTKSFDGWRDRYIEEQRLRCVGLEKQISDARHSFDERANTDLRRNEETFQKIFKIAESRDTEMGRIRDTISRLQERTETHLRKLDQYDTKLDTLLRDVSAAAARGVKSAQQ